MAFGPEQCILVFDDLDLPLGTVKTRLNGGAGGHRGVGSILEAFQSDATRLNGGAGGHRGVASILEAFQTDAFPRVKIGVDQEGAKLNRVDYVLTPFAAANRDAVAQAILTAEAHLLKILTARLQKAA